MTRTRSSLVPSFAALACALVAAVLVLAQPAAAQTKLEAPLPPVAKVPLSREQIHLSFAPLVKKVAPAVVNIYATKVVRQQASPLFADPFFRHFFGPQFGFGRPRSKVENSLGSGVIVDRDGVIVTNNHVIAGADEIKVVLSDRREFDAKIIGVDERSDLAVLRVDTGGEWLPALQMRDSDTLEVGDLVLAIGNPFGVGQTVTSGIVSAVARTQVGINDLGFFIQTDAAINPGNSGGALVSMDGRLVGINTAIFSKSGGSMGIGFATPSNMVRSVVAGFTSGHGLVRPWLGAEGQTVTPEIASAMNLPRPMGVIINKIHPLSPLRDAGVQVGDVIASVGGRPVDDPQALRYRIATRPVGGTIELSVWRDGSAKRTTMKLVAAPETPPAHKTELSGANPLAGATVANMSPALAEKIGVDPLLQGVFVLAVRNGSTASRLDFKEGDQIMAINGDDTNSVGRLKMVLAKQANRWRVALKRGDQVLNWVINR